MKLQCLARSLSALQKRAHNFVNDYRQRHNVALSMRREHASDDGWPLLLARTWLVSFFLFSLSFYPSIYLSISLSFLHASAWIRRCSFSRSAKSSLLNIAVINDNVQAAARLRLAFITYILEVAMRFQNYTESFQRDAYWRLRNFVETNNIKILRKLFSSHTR